jgi:2-polyprenyl-3-methyl-5-hydroxy-6-metoxy-1,4-benzoquinol methylase
MGWMDQRSSQKEVMDEIDVGVRKLLPSFRFMRMVNRWLGGTSAVLHFLETTSIPEREFTVLDLGTGCGDIPVAIQKWAKQNKKKAHITAIDTNPHFIEYAKKHSAHPGIGYLCHSAFDIESLGTFDYIIASMFFHHLPDERIVALLQKMFQHCRRGFLVNDLYRHPIAYAGVAALTALRFDPVLFHDAKLSVKRGFRETDALNYRDWSGIDQLQIQQRPGFRLTMSCRH